MIQYFRERNVEEHAFTNSFLLFDSKVGCKTYYIYIYIYGVSECLTMNSAIRYWQTLPARSMHGKSNSRKEWVNGDEGGKFKALVGMRPKFTSWMEIPR